MTRQIYIIIDTATGNKIDGYYTEFLDMYKYLSTLNEVSHPDKYSIRSFEYSLN